MIYKFDNQEDFFPKVLIPNSLKDKLVNGLEYKILEKDIQLEKPERKKIFIPTHPEKTKYIHIKTFGLTDFGSLGNSIICLIFCYAIFKILTTIFFIENTLPLIMFLIILFLYLFSLSEKYNYERNFLPEKSVKAKEVAKSELEYQKDIYEYKLELKEYENDVKIIEKNYKIDNENYLKLLKEEKLRLSYIIYKNNLRPHEKITKVLKPPKRGLSEIDFIIQAQTKLKNYFYHDITSDGSLYCPDLVFICPDTNLHIDIEIDEPYTMLDKNPIHYNGADKNRNDFFLERRWIIIRFAEEQIIKTPDECINTILSILNSIKSIDDSYVSRLKPIKSWEYDETLNMIENNYRKGYLNS